MQEHERLMLAARIADMLRPLSDADRYAVLSELPFCPHCGTEDRDCQCSNDE